MASLVSDIQYPPYLIPEKTVHEYILRKVKENIESGLRHPAWINTITGECIEYVDIEPISRRTASALVKRGFQKGDIVIYASDNVTHLPLFTLSVWRSGGIMRSSYPEDTNEDLLERIVDSKCRFVLCDEVLGRRYSSLLNNAQPLIDWSVEVFVFGKAEGCTSVTDLFLDDGKAFPESVQVSLEDPYLILNTSGSTGKSKGAIYTHSNSIPVFEMADIRKSSSSILALGRPTHLSGATLPFNQAIHGAPFFSMHKVSSTALLEAVDKYKPEVIFGFPAYLMHLVEGPNAENYDRSSIKVILTGGIALTPEQRRKFQKFPNLEAILCFYGLTECSQIATTTDMANSGRTRKELPGLPSNCVGRLLPNTSVRIYDEETGTYNSPGVHGEIIVKSAVTISGYWNLPEESKTLYVDGYLRTGDLGYYDENGLLYLLDRKKETFKYFNNHISPSEIEGILKSHPDVENACVIGVRDTSSDGDTIPRAFVILKSNAYFESISSPPPSEEEIKQYAEKKLAEYKHIRGGLFIIESLPLGKTGKPSRLLLAQMPLNQKLPK